MKKQVFFCLFFSFFTLAQGQSFEEEVFDEFKKADERWIEFKNNLTIYLDEIKPPSRKADEGELDIYFAEKWEASYQGLQQKIGELQQSFWDFREKLEEVVAHHAENIHASYAKASVSAEVTQWYTTYLEKNLFGFEPGKQREIKTDLKLSQDVTRSFPYSFVEPPYISPYVIHSLTPPWPSYAQNDESAIELWNGQSKAIENYEFPAFTQELGSLETASFEYSYIGKTDQDVYVLLTDECTGGRGQFKGLLFFTIEVEPYLADENGERERIVIKRVGEHFLGDRWFGQLKVEGNQVTLLTEGYRQTEIKPQSVILDLQHFFPSRPLSPIFAERLVTRNEDGPLFWAVYQDDSDTLLALMDERISKELIQRLLHIASRHDCFKCLSILLDHEGDPNFANREGNTPLHCAVDGREFECVKKLIEKGALINAENFHGLTSLVLAVKKGKPEVVNYLLEKGAAFDFVDQDGKNLLHYALYDGWDCEIAERLFSLGVKANRSDMLPQAACLGSRLIVSHMLDQGVDINSRNQWEETALMNCFRFGEMREDLADYLLEKGADPFAHKWDGDAPILKIIDFRSIHLLQKCLSKGVDLNCKRLKISLLYRAAEIDWLEGVRLLLEQGANVNLQNSSDSWSKGGRTPLHAAAENGNLEMVKLLRRHGADLSPPDVKTPFALAAECNHKNVLLYFISQGFLSP
ncbi:MAG: ankyrin repeat domain-containing protein [Chlamydiales bacterium]|nr:ankyrin repeat domain-containing protein [Chlamydiales bacterium]